MNRADQISGVIPRAAMALFDKLEGSSNLRLNNRNSMTGLRAPTRYTGNPAGMLARSAEKTWTLKATYVEIYNEMLRDLLVPEGVPHGERGHVTIREDAKGHILLTGLHQVEINSVEDLLAALNFGSMIRQTDSTAINAKSSRSHAVFSLNLVQRKSNLQTAQGREKRFSVPLEAMTGVDSTFTIDSKFHFVDLAGSERLKNTGAQGERAKEGISINAGLASLGKVISQLSSRQAGSHVSYRDSKLTRLLQDSLGGNAITYMIACVTPAEFHLSETLNTVQYAQRARAIQSKPRIQQVSDESDKVALIERLKAEVAFLREQIRSTERNGDRPAHSTPGRPERQNEREVELQNQLLDTQENYTALSGRHAKLISEMARARDNEVADNQAFESTLGDSATERLKRSNTFAEAVEQVVLEYEKTIQSLEQSLSSTRGSLSETETLLLEKETKCAYVETVNVQLQARLQKLIDRETSTENYLHDLEAKLDGHTSGEEKNSAIIMELRKEIARVRENEAACEDYISTLEERLAEADQDAELMQREIDRLEHVVERQRSLGKLDSLLHELDHAQQPGENSNKAESGVRNGRNSQYNNSRRQSAVKDAIPETEESEADIRQTKTEGTIARKKLVEGEKLTTKLEPSDDHYPPSPAQSKFVEDKFEIVSQELFDLKVEHESTVNEFDNLARKYEEALRTLAELQDAVDEARHLGNNNNRDSLLSMPQSPTSNRPTSFLPDARVSELLKHGVQYSSSRSLSSELFSAGELPSAMETSDAETVAKKSESGDVASSDASNDTIALEVESLRKLAAEKEQAQKVLSEKYAQLEEQHMDALDLVEELKTEVSKARLVEASSPRSGTAVIRRKSSQSVMIIDKAHRAFASLRNIAADNFEDSPDVMANFELSLNTAMHELHSRSERIQELEADITAAKKEMETKMTIISGLTRERSSMKASPMDMSVVSSMRDQLLQNEGQMRMLQETHIAREQELQAELEALRSSIKEHVSSSKDQQGPVKQRSAEHDTDKETRAQRFADLEIELANLEGRHRTALKSMESSEKDLLDSISGLEKQLAVAKSEQQTGRNNAEVGAEHDPGTELISTLQQEIDEHKTAVAANAARVAELERSHAATLAQLDDVFQSRNDSHAEVRKHKKHISDLEQSHAATQKQLDALTRSRDESHAEAERHKVLVARLEQQIAEHEIIVKTHQDGFRLLHANHAKALEDLRSSTHQDHQVLVAELTTKHQASTEELQNALAEARDEITRIATQVAVALDVDIGAEKLEDRISDLLADQKAMVEESKKVTEMELRVAELLGVNDTLKRELDGVKAELAELLAQTAEGARYKNEHATVAEQLAALRKELTELETKNKKNSRLVEELEDQLASNFDQHQIANNRLSLLQTERNAQLEEANAALARAQLELDNIKEEYIDLRVSKLTPH